MANGFPAETSIDIRGAGQQSGAYVLGIALDKPLTVVFGRFRGGRPVALAAGSYLYIGSAMGQRGSNSLAHRLLRHATRSNARPPQSIRPVLLSALRDAGLGPGSLRPPRVKTLHWHVDYLLDQPAASLVAVLAVRSAQVLERPLAAWVAVQPQSAPVAPGLGASDHPGQTHLFQVEQTAALWRALGKELARWPDTT